MVITPLMQKVKLPALTDFQLVEEETSTSYEAPWLSYTEKGMRIINQSPLTKSFSTSKIPQFQPKSIKTISNNSTYKVKLAYFNGQSWIDNKVLIDTRVSQCHCIPLPIPVFSTDNYNFVIYDGREATLTQKAKIMMKTPNSTLVEYECYVDNSINNNHYHILLGMNFLDHFETYDIKPTQIILVDKQNTIMFDRI